MLMSNYTLFQKVLSFKMSTLDLIKKNIMKLQNDKVMSRDINLKHYKKC